MIKAGENTESFAKLNDSLEAAKNNDISAGIYWLIKNTEKELAKEEVSKAKEIATGVKDKKLKFSFYFTFEPTNELISKNETISEFCKEIPIDCGLSLSYDNYTDYYKNYNGELQNIKNYWINTNNENASNVIMYELSILSNSSYNLFSIIFCLILSFISFAAALVNVRINSSSICTPSLSFLITL